MHTDRGLDFSSVQHVLPERHTQLRSGNAMHVYTAVTQHNGEHDELVRCARAHRRVAGQRAWDNIYVRGYRRPVYTRTRALHFRRAEGDKIEADGGSIALRRVHDGTEFWSHASDARKILSVEVQDVKFETFQTLV